MASLQRTEIWTDYQCNSGTRQAVLPLDHITRLTTTERTSHEDDGVLVISKEAAAYSYLTVGSVLRLLFTDGSFSEWRIRSLDDQSKSSRVVTAVLATPLSELATGAAILSSYNGTTASVTLEWKALTPTAVVTSILAFCPAFWAIGTITPTIPVNLSPAGWMPLQALRELVTAIRAQGVDAELDFRRNGTTGYYVDIVSAIGSSASALDVRTAKNLLGSSRLRDRDRYALEVVPLGVNSVTMAQAYLEVTNKSGTTLTVQQPVVGGSVIAFDGQFDGLYLFDDAGAKQLISSTLAGAGTFVVASAANVTSGRWYRLTLDSSGNDLIRVRKAPATAGPIQVVRSSLDGVNNLVPNPAMRIWTGGAGTAPDGWSKGSGTYTKTQTAGLWVYGGQSCRVQTSGTAMNLESTRQTFYIPAWVTNIVFSVWVYHIQDTNNTFGLTGYKDGVAWTSKTLISPASGFQRIDIVQSAAGFTGATHSLSCRLDTTSVSTLDTYIDSCQITFSAAAQDFTEGSSAARLLAVANRYLSKYSTVPAIYRLTFADLHAWNPTDFAWDAVSLGQTANAKDTDLAFTISARVLELMRDWKDPLASEITLSSRPDDLVTILSGIAA